MARNPELAAAIGANLREAREAAGLSQREAGEHLGLPQHRISEWECGKYLISIPFLMELAHRYSASLLQLVGAPECHPSVFRFDDDPTEYDPTGEWVDEDGDGWTLQGWLYPVTGARPVPLMQLTRSGDEAVHASLAYLSDLINELGARREKEA